MGRAHEESVKPGGRRQRWRNSVLRFEGACRASAETVYDLLADLEIHWSGRARANRIRNDSSPCERR